MYESSAPSGVELGLKIKYIDNNTKKTNAIVPILYISDGPERICEDLSMEGIILLQRFRVNFKFVSRFIIRISFTYRKTLSIIIRVNIYPVASEEK